MFRAVKYIYMTSGVATYKLGSQLTTQLCGETSIYRCINIGIFFCINSYIWLHNLKLTTQDYISGTATVHDRLSARVCWYIILLYATYSMLPSYLEYGVYICIPGVYEIQNMEDTTILQRAKIQVWFLEDKTVMLLCPIYATDTILFFCLVSFLFCGASSILQLVFLGGIWI